MTRPTGPPGAEDHPDKEDHRRRQPRQRQQPPAPIRSSAAVYRSVTHLRVLAGEGEISLTGTVTSSRFSLVADCFSYLGQRSGDGLSGDGYATWLAFTLSGSTRLSWLREVISSLLN